MRARRRKFPRLCHQTDRKYQAATRIGDATPMFQGSSSAMRLMGWSAIRPTTSRKSNSFRIEAVELGGFDKRIGYGSALSAGIGSGEQIAVPPRPAASRYAYCHHRHSASR